VAHSVDGVAWRPALEWLPIYGATRRNAKTYIERSVLIAARDTWQTMSADPTTDAVALTRRIFEAGSRGDLDLVVSLYAANASFDMSPLGLGVFEGRAALRSFLDDWFGAYDQYEVELEQTVDFGDGVVLAVIAQKGRITDSEGVVELRYAAVALVADGEVVLTTNYSDLDEARRAAERLAAEHGGSSNRPSRAGD
jgi:ketosteroid isomerase-like protein